MSNNPVGLTSQRGVPGVPRRLMSVGYEILLGLAVLFLPFLLFEIATGAGHTPLVEHLRQALAFIVLGLYFIHQWTREGQTLAMRTWRLQLVQPGHARVTPRAAVVRYLLSWMWVLPAVVACQVFDLQHWRALAALGVGVLLWASTAYLDRNRQFLHDRLSGTRLVQLPPREKKKKKLQETPQKTV